MAGVCGGRERGSLLRGVCFSKFEFWFMIVLRINLLAHFTASLKKRDGFWYVNGIFRIARIEEFNVGCHAASAASGITVGVTTT